ncbi:hypothetical protein LTT66_12035 [Nocardia gipuzkoensis]|uniref:hypothetical protein n=1 Tax=Nocardia TaxID=1817 RepID=UPI001E50FE42|nr:MULTISPECIES: hypothetical protein [Nocardia]UGT70830.1 hypothetical protein LTT66_12035 [Nocardia gipuzkoensis]
MRAPTRAQAAVLKALQNQTVFLNRMVATATERQRQTGQTPPQSWYEDYQGRALLREALIDAASAGGVPRVWIDHVRERGDRGTHWRADLYLRTPEPTDWDRVLGDLSADVHQLREWTALHTVNDRINPSSDATIVAEVEGNLRALRYRTAAVANLLGLTSEEGHDLWGDAGEWAHAALASVDGLPAEQVAQRWQQVARTDTRSYALQATALNNAGIAIDTAAALCAHEELVHAITIGLTLPPPLFQSANTTGADIAAAVDAAIPTGTAVHDTETDRAKAVFSHAADTQAWVNDPTTDHDIGAPQFSSPGEGYEQ